MAMGATGNTVASSRLGRLARRTASAAQAQAEATQERCDLCDQPIPSQHRHLLDLSARELKCVCQPCRILFDSGAAGGGHYRLVPDRRLRIEDFELDDPGWSALRIPVDMAFLFHSTAEDRAVAFYPGAMGATESLLKLRSWEAIEAANPVLRGMEPDVEALLINRARGAREHWLVPIEDCYALAGLIRTHWKGLTGGKEVWEEIGRFFEELGGRASLASRHDGTEEPNASTAATPGAERSGDG